MREVSTSIAVDAIRLHWVKGLNQICGKLNKSLSGWLCDENYQVYQPLERNGFLLYIADDRELLSSIAYDCTRMAVASFETIASVEKHPSFPKSSAWVLLKSYYAAFFAAHTILRMFGISCSQIGFQEAKAVSKIASLYGNANNLTVSSGFYACQYDSQKKFLSCNKINIGAGGVHESFWSVFCQRVRSLSDEILISSSNSSESQLVSVKLAELCSNLSYGHCTDGSWLSFIRNEVNYRHRFGCWFPYRDYSQANESLLGIRKIWRGDPMTMNLRYPKGKELEQFKMTCAFIISLCRLLIIEMAKRCPEGKSFHLFGALSVLNHLKQKHTMVSAETLSA